MSGTNLFVQLFDTHLLGYHVSLQSYNYMSTTTHGHFPSMWTNLDGQMAQDNHSFCFRNQAACIHNVNSQRFTYRFATDNQIISVLRKSRISTKLIGFLYKI
jgi:hypothetical protein